MPNDIPLYIKVAALKALERDGLSFPAEIKINPIRLTSNVPTNQYEAEIKGLIPAKGLVNLIMVIIVPNKNLRDPHFDINIRGKIGNRIYLSADYFNLEG